MDEKARKVGLALGGGAARGIAHIGVLQVFQEHSIPVDMIVGTSIGAIMGAIYAAGTDLKWLEKLVLTLNWDQLVDLTVPRMGFLKVEKLFQLVELLCKQKKIEDLDILYRAVAVDIKTGEEVILSSGSAARAAMASAAIPGVFLPQEFGDMLLVDGGIRNQVPVQPVRELGADLVIAVDVGGSVQKMEVRSVMDIILQTLEIMQYEANSAKINEADILIRPELSQVGPFDLKSASYSLQAGRVAAEAAIPEIRAALDRIGRTCGKRRVEDATRAVSHEAKG